jgi:gentisate 1,2-dioxygenase
MTGIGTAAARGASGETMRELQAFYQEISVHNIAPLWERLHELITKAPSSAAKPAKWDYDNVVRPHLMKAAALISAKEAERRVLILENPGLPGKACVTRSLYAGIQLIMPGEVAPAHRHSQSALRFILEGSGAYTTVEGERTLMQPGDFVLTPSWKWHDHGNDTDAPMMWLDGLDIPVVSFFDTSFAESSLSDRQVLGKPIDDSRSRFGNNMVPVDWHSSDSHSPLINYPYTKSREALLAMVHAGAPDLYHGHKMRFINPADGSSPMPTLGAFMQLLPGGFSTKPYRSTDGTVFSVVEGEGESEVGSETIQWKPRDVFVVPSWSWHTHRARSGAVLFSFSDRPAQRALGLWREERGTHS